MTMETQDIFNNPVCRQELRGLSKDEFTVRRRIDISSLHPRQRWLDKECLDQKIKGRNHTTVYVGCMKDKNILFDGHHTAAAKKINGQKYIMALCLDL